MKSGGELIAENAKMLGCWEGGNLVHFEGYGEACRDMAAVLAGAEDGQVACMVNVACVEPDGKKQGSSYIEYTASDTFLVRTDANVS